MSSNLSRRLDDFVGDWQLSRRIYEHQNNTVFCFEGDATFTWHNDILCYSEKGMVTAPDGKTLLAERQYYWQQGHNGEIEVLFDDKRYFHAFSAVQTHADHLCGEDYYQVDYAFQQWPSWSSIWEVKGPRKDYRMESNYTKR